MQCPSCNASLTEGSNFCEECGVALPRACPSCAHANSAKAKFCSKCGASLTPGISQSAARGINDTNGACRRAPPTDHYVLRHGGVERAFNAA
jgi:predicted amidophosphoribosyltransferase